MLSYAKRKAYMAYDPKLTITANDEERIVRMDLQQTHGQFQSWFSAMRPVIQDQVYRMNYTAAHAEKSTVCVDPQSKRDKPRIHIPRAASGNP